jgi:hypothetical protein
MLQSESKRDLYDRLINNKWPSPLPVPSDQEAITGAKRLYRKAMSRPWKGEVKVTSGNRHTWIRGRTMYVNPDGWPSSWRGIVHGIAHWCHYRLNPRDSNHSDKQARLERDLTNYVLANGFLTGALKSKARPKAQAGIVFVRYQRLLEREKSWRAKLSRAQSALAKVQREKQEYQRRHGSRLVNSERAAAQTTTLS